MAQAVFIESRFNVKADYYILDDDGEPKLVNCFETWTMWMRDAEEEDNACLIAVDSVGDTRIITKFIGIQFASPKLPSAYWETRVHGGKLDLESNSSAVNREEALKQHEDAVKRVVEVE